MRLEKAKEIIDLNIKVAGPKMPPDTLEALKLHAEAVSMVLSDRQASANPIYLPLRGETVETDSP